MKVQKIFIGLLDIASQLYDWKRGFEKIGIDTITASYRKIHFGQKNIVDYELAKEKKLSFRGVRPRVFQRYLQEYWEPGKQSLWRKAVNECDTFMFVGSSFYRNASDFQKLKKLGKKVILFCVGDDVRWYYAMEQEFKMFGMHPIPYSNYNFTISNLEENLRYLRNAEKYADYIFSSPNQAQLALRPYHKAFIPLDLSDFRYNSEQSQIPVVIHAPSSISFKGTEFILEAIDKLKNEGLQFIPKFITNMNNEEAILEYSKADIIVVQIFCPSGGKLSYEGLALGKVVLSKMSNQNGSYNELIPSDCPIIDIDRDNIYSVLKGVIVDYPKRKDLASKALPYIQKYNDNKVVCEKLINIVENNTHPEFFPTFFRDHFIPESDKATILYNKYNILVRSCDWYKKFIPSGKRGDLLF